MNEGAIKAWIKGHEGFRSNVYKDTKGLLTVGVGHLIQVGDILPKDLLMSWFAEDFAVAQGDLRHLKVKFKLPPFGPVREAVLVGMFFQMGWSRVLGFKNMIKALVECDWNLAADEMIDSKWARDDTPGRAKEASKMMRTGRSE